jgi:hypothetical protein
VKRSTVLLAVAVLTLLAIRAYDSQRGPPLEPWHTFVPDELRAEDIDASDWDAYLRAEDGVFESVRTEVTDRLDAGDRVPVNRYFEGSVVYPRTSLTTGIGPTCSSPTAGPSAPSCCCTG